MQSSNLDGLIKQAMKLTESVKSEIEMSSQQAKISLTKSKEDCILQLELIVKRQEADIDRIKTERLKELDEKKATFVSAVKDYQKAKDTSPKSGSNYEVISAYSSLSQQLNNLFRPNVPDNVEDKSVFTSPKRELSMKGNAPMADNVKDAPVLKFPKCKRSLTWNAPLFENVTDIPVLTPTKRQLSVEGNFPLAGNNVKDMQILTSPKQQLSVTKSAPPTFKVGEAPELTSPKCQLSLKGNTPLADNVEDVPLLASTQQQLSVKGNAPTAGKVDNTSVLRATKSPDFELPQNGNAPLAENVEASPLLTSTKRQLSVQKNPPPNWKLSGQFNTGDFNRVLGLAVNQDGDIAVASFEKGVKVESRTGDVKCKLGGPLGALSVAITPDQQKYVVAPVNVAYITFHDRKGNRLYTAPVTDINNMPSNVNSVAIDADGKIIVGQVDNTISIHQPDGAVISKFATTSEPFRLATTSNGEIVSSFCDPVLKQSTDVRLMDYSGGNVRVIPPPPCVMEWSPGFIGCSKGEIFVVNEGAGDPTGVYQYTASGDYLGCVTTDVINPEGIALSEDGRELFVAEYLDNMVKIFQRQ